MASKPITRQEMLLNAVATGEVASIEPITREEMFLAKAGGQDVQTPTPITRKEMFLQKIAQNGGGVGGSVETCTVILDANERGYTSKNTVITGYAFSVYENGAFTTKILAPAKSFYNPTAIENILCGSVCTITTDATSDEWTTSGATKDFSVSNNLVAVFTITAQGGETATITYG